MLRKCLDSLVKQRAGPDGFEVIVVDNNSSDNTREIVARYQDKLLNLKYVFEGNQGLSYARNRGCAEAGAEYLVYLDDDAVVPPDYLDNVTRVIREHAPDIMGGPVYPYYTSPKPRWFKDEYETRKYRAESGFSTHASVSGGNFIIRKNVLEKAGLFDVNLGMKGGKMDLGEERKVLELYRAATPENKQKVYYALECWVEHHVPPEKMTLGYIMKRSYIAGVKSRQIISVHHKNGADRADRGFLASGSRSLKNAASKGYQHVRRQGLKGVDLVGMCRAGAMYAGIYIGANLEKLRPRKGKNGNQHP
jgi:glycosyltransferase involved in cell wall biosynthesis